LSGGVGDGSPDDEAQVVEAYRFRRLRRVSVKGYTRLEAWRLKRPKDGGPDDTREDSRDD